MLFLVMFLMFMSIALLSYALIPFAVTEAGALNKRRSQQFLRKMDRVLQEDDVQKAYRLYLIAPLALSIAGLVFAPPAFRFAGVCVGLAAGLIFPNMWIKHLIAQRKNKFKDQMMDALMIMSSSFRGGLSLIQAIETVVWPTRCLILFTMNSVLFLVKTKWAFPWTKH
jgi:Flp pilus assembly protein TadB